MAKMPQLNAIQLAKIVQKLGFNFIRQTGSHMFFKHDGGRGQ
jgi:predicted RNA binding protein YcfA (HicA-like mRNA interferase family)